jgi:SEC-C motif-containing protein
MFSTWLGLEVKNTLINNETGVVEFEAWYLDGKDTGCLHEISDFRKIMGKWFYLKGEVNDRKPTKDEQLKWSIKPVLNSTKENTVLGRNDVCFCGSGKNLKKCCLSM